MKRRKFLAAAAASAVLPSAAVRWAAAAGATQGVVRWIRGGSSRLFTQVECDGQPMARPGAHGLLAGRVRVRPRQTSGEPLLLTGQRSTGRSGAVTAKLSHHLYDANLGRDEDLLEATLTIQNTSSQSIEVEIGFVSSVRPHASAARAEAYLPLSAAGISRDHRFDALGCQSFLTDCRQPLGKENFQCHYLEPMASYPEQRVTQALLLAPVVDISHPDTAWHVAFFTPSDQPMRFETLSKYDANRGWHAGRYLTLAAGQSVEQRCWLLLHQGDASVAWQAFHRFGHREEFAVPDWVREFRVHYYDFLSSADGAGGRRGAGYLADAKHFRDFHVGLATQHGYYLACGDFIHPDRKTWQAMSGDGRGPAQMSLEEMRRRIQATRATGARAAVYMHPALFDGAGPNYDRLRECILHDAAGAPIRFHWNGPDMIGKGWRMSLAAQAWQDHLLQQTEWIMELLDPDAIVVDETFAGLGYDEHPDRAGPMSGHAIDLYRKMRAIVKSRGADRALFASDCSMANFVTWTDGEGGDHAYPNSLGNPLYRQEPVRFMAALGDRPWRPCAWHFRQMWQLQMELARLTGSGVGVSNGWAEYTGLAGLPTAERQKLIADIESLL